MYDTTSEPDNEYHARNVLRGGDCLSSHALITYLQSPAAYRSALSGLGGETSTNAYQLGRAAHCVILEGDDAYNARYVSGGPINDKTGQPYGERTKAWSEWAASQRSAGREVITASDDVMCHRLAAGVNANDEARELLTQGMPERIARARYCGEKCQIKIDWLSSNAIVDLKTCRELSRFEYDFRDYKYANQLSFYQRVFESYALTLLPVFVIAIEKKSPYACAVFSVDQSRLDDAQRENEAGINQLRKSRLNDIWPTGWEGILKIK